MVVVAPRALNHGISSLAPDLTGTPRDVDSSTVRNTNMVQADMYFLTRSKVYDTVKPYSMRYSIEDFPQSNVQRESRRIRLHDIRHLAQEPKVETHGFEVIQFNSRMKYNDFEDVLFIESIYQAEIAAKLKDRLGATHTFVMDHAVRRRDPNFPVSTGKDYQHDQPTWMSHIGNIYTGLVVREKAGILTVTDFSREEGERMLQKLYGHGAPEILRHRWQIINVWKPLRGPVKEWPLGIVDARTVDFGGDTMAGDIVFPTWTTENLLVMHNPAFEWFYLSDQTIDEALIFKSADSDENEPFACPHAGFNFAADENMKPQPRESIDCRVFVLYAPIDDFPPEVGKLYTNDIDSDEGTQ